jgi:hypothetical protein
MRKLIMLLLCLFLFHSSYADEKPSIQTELYPQTARIGDSVHLVFKIFRPEDSKLKTPDTLTNAHDIQIKDLRLKDEKKGKTNIQTVVEYTLVCFEPGPHILEPISFKLQTSSGENIVLQSEKITLTIESLIKDPSKENDIRGPKPQLQIKASWLPVFIIVFFLALLTAIIWFIVRKVLGKPEQNIQQDIILSPDEEALQQLEELLISSDMKQKNMKVIYTRLTDILRNYLGKKYSFDAREMTSFECLKEIKIRKLGGVLYEKIKLSLEKADLVKFAKFLPENTEIPADIETAKNIVIQTREVVYAP